MSTLITRDYAASSKRTYPPTGGIFYASIQGTLQTNPAAADAEIPQTQDGMASNLRVRAVQRGDAGTSSTVTLLLNGEPTDFS